MTTPDQLPADMAARLAAAGYDIEQRSLDYQGSAQQRKDDEQTRRAKPANGAARIEAPAPAIRTDERLFTTADHLRATEHAAPAPLIEGLLFIGLTLFHGPAKKGKSWFLLHMLLALDAGAEFLGRPVQRCDALYVGCEDDSARFKSRLERMFARGTLRMMSRAQLELFATRYAEQQTPVMVDQVVTELWILTGKPRVIAIDTQEVFEAVLGIRHGAPGATATQRDYQATSSYDRIASRLGIAIITVGHWGELKNIEKACYNPHECINTTKARLAGASTSITLGPLPNQEPGDYHHEMQLSVRGRDLIGGDQFLWLTQDRDTGCFRCLGTVSDVQLTDAQSRLFGALLAARKEHGPEHWVTGEDLADTLDCSRQAVKQMAARVRRAAKAKGRKPMYQGLELESRTNKGYRLK